MNCSIQNCNLSKLLLCSECKYHVTDMEELEIAAGMRGDGSGETKPLARTFAI